MYTVRFYKGEYIERQRQANSDDAACYVEHHFNSSDNPRANYCVVIVSSKASALSRQWAEWYAGRVGSEFNVTLGGSKGVVIGGFNGRGDNNIRHAKMPAILVEPLFGSNPRHARIIKSSKGQDKLAGILAESIRKFFPSGGLAAFSVGHKYKRKNPRDRGAGIYGGGWEADYAEIILRKAAVLIESL